MRKITSKKETEKKDRKKQWIVGLVLISIMLVSTAGYSFSRFASKNSWEMEYNGFKFVKQNGLWNTEINGLTFSFTYSPKEIDVNSNAFLNLGLSNYNGLSLYIQSEDINSEYEIYRNLDSVILRRQYACLEGEKCNDNFPIKTCDENFIIIRESNSSQIRLDKNCVFIEGTKEKLVKITDGFLFKIIGIK